ncbi:hypothetical protein FB567DRAFT_602291 [Paraphoma chrysanthemicola]|uniref:Uncharacterized protein n=1 Tax=Paraphoma chrysanthemicola TaxID=798071 RepID=A0A8K0VYF0_9PLEO|nr:hypothetical protein FB567DRAFT_602291 [Paraphoma chrysanthemicola]
MELFNRFSTSIATITTRNDLNSTLLRLPGKIRNQIFRPNWRIPTLPLYIQRKSRYRLSLLAVCRRTYKETTLLPFSLNDFSFEDTYDLEEYVIEHLRVAQRNAITSVQISVYLDFRDSDDIRIDSAYSHLHKLLPAVGKVLIKLQIPDFDLDLYPRSCDETVRLAKERLNEWLLNKEAKKTMKILYKEVAF